MASLCAWEPLRYAEMDAELGATFIRASLHQWAFAPCANPFLPCVLVAIFELSLFRDWLRGPPNVLPSICGYRGAPISGNLDSQSRWQRTVASCPRRVDVLPYDVKLHVVEPDLASPVQQSAERDARRVRRHILSSKPSTGRSDLSPSLSRKIKFGCPWLVIGIRDDKRACVD
jgi:hypothetical protein